MPEKISAYAKGVMGEEAACDYLCRRGMEKVAARYRSPYGEIDLIMRDGETLAFVEVKARERLSGALTRCAVTPDKQKRMIHTVRCFLAQYPQYAHYVLRFDVVTVTREGIDYIPNAFDGAAW